MHPARQRSVPRLLNLAVAFVLLAGLVQVAGTQAATLRPVRLEAGPQVGYTFSSSGAILTTKTVTVSGPFNTQTDDRRWIPGRGAHLRITTGALTGLYVRESMVAYIPGLVRTANYATPVRVAFPAGTYLGYTFDTAWGLNTTKRYTLVTSSGALTSGRGMINGRPYARIVSGIWNGYWMPITTPTTLAADRIRCSVPAKVAPGAQQIFRILPGAASQVALTFDMGGRLDPAVDVLERLVIDRVCATLFPTGASSLTTVGKQAMALVKAHPELFEVGNHTYLHCNFRDGGGGSVACPTSPPSATYIKEDLLKTANVIKSLTGQNPAPYWRPPYGAYDSRVLAAVAAAGYTKTFMWHIDTIDWRHVTATPTPGPTAAQIVSKVVTNAVNGSVVLMHLGGWNTLDALPSMVSQLRARGLTPTTASEILR
jgi:peptidoglycan/xylan/chitin deacetylase (PgdA/CDA1 family)